MNAGTKLAESAAIRRSQAQASDMPAPAAGPLTEAITGFSSERSARTFGLKVVRSRVAMSPASSRKAFKSWPTQNPRPAPVTTTARTAASRASLSASRKPVCISASNAFRTSGRLSVIVRTPPSRWVRTALT
jgi:hypothetical protein